MLDKSKTSIAYDELFYSKSHSKNGEKHIYIVEEKYHQKQECFNHYYNKI